MTVRFAVYVVPRSAAPGPHGRFAGTPRLRVRAPASDGRANDEAISRLGRLLGAPVRLVGGARSRRKTFAVSLERAALERRLREAFGA